MKHTELIEVEKKVGLYWVPLVNTLSALMDSNGEFRIKPKTRSVTVDGMLYEWPEPMRVAPEDGTPYWFFTSGNEYAGQSEWHDRIYDRQLMKDGYMQATREGAEAHRRALVAVSGGSLE